MKKYIKSNSNGLVYENYGDVNFLDGGCIIAKDGDYYNVVTCDFVYDTLGDHNYLIQDCYVDIDDSWINQAEIEQYCGCNKEEDPDWFAKCCVDYYGGENFGANIPPSGLSNYDDYLYTAEGVEQYMKRRYNLPSDIHFG